MRTPTWPIPLALLALSVGACGADAASSNAGAFDTNSWNSPDAASSDTSSASDTWTPNDTAGSSDAVASDTYIPPPPVETEEDFDLRTPEAGGSYLYIPSAGLDALVVVDATNLAVHLVEVGVEPTLVRALPDDRGAVVLNSGSYDISIVRPLERGEFAVKTVDVLADHNRMVLSPDGDWAFVWFDPTAGGGGFGSLQDVSAVRLVPGAEVVYNLAVGYRPTEVHFTASGTLALFFCENGISGVRLAELDGDAFLPPVAVDANPFQKPSDREIKVTPSGDMAVVRDLVVAPRLTLVGLQDHSIRTLDLPDWPSDLDMTPDGGRVVVPMKTTEQVAIVQVPEAFMWEAPAPADENATVPDNPFVTLSFTGSHFGSTVLTADGARALLYTTDPGTQAIGMVDVASGEIGVQPLAKEVTSVLVSLDGRMAALLHRKTSGSDASLLDVEAYSLLDLDSGFSKIVTVDNPVKKVIFTDDSRELFVLMPDLYGADHLVHRVSTRSFAVIPYATPDAPVFVGAMPSIHKVAIALNNPTGWITLIDTEDNSVDQVNSFELNSFIE
ncbi:MAG: hypothetical protein CVU56_08435 [Deltaproteobacteria bacterium HGW-Deltaproteobacteria-14]|jgi:hypothetical protein|nr:MAG: hypothetical protein CVU56_08435 [Deltaproteobacteria bacterium HGW-Deltaproteobacteria-14]